MARQGGKARGGGQAPPRRVLLRLYVAGLAPNSAAALANLKALLPSWETTKDQVELEVVDVLEDPGRALAEGITVSPTLVRTFPLPVVRIVGSLGDPETVRLALGLGK